MKNNILRLLIITLAVFAAGCADKLGIEPVNTIDAGNAVKTSADVEALLVGAYDALGNGDLYGGNLLRDSELLGDAGEVFWDGTFVAPQEIYSKSILITNDQAEETWLEAYEAINISNTVLANLGVVTTTKAARVEGEAKFIRAAVYFELVRLYAKAWNDGNPANNPGVPLVLEPTTPANVSNKATRATVADVYAQIVSDLTSAQTLLPANNGFFATTNVASAMLSRVYLQQQDYAKALTAANTVITSNRYSLLGDYAANFNNSSNGASNATAEDIFSIQITDQDGTNNMNTFFASADYAGRGDIYIEPAHFALYEAGDERLDLFYDGERTGKWNNQFGNVNIIRLAEMYLTRAEANFRLGSAVGATPLDDVNLIRDRVGLAPLLILALNDILRERHLELAFEGHLLHDTKRTQANVGALSFNDPSLIFPIPQRERNVNPDLQQNEGYGN